MAYAAGNGGYARGGCGEFGIGKGGGVDVKSGQEHVGVGHCHRPSSDGIPSSTPDESPPLTGSKTGVVAAGAYHVMLHVIGERGPGDMTDDYGRHSP